MSDRRKNSTRCKQCRVTNTHRRSGICVICAEGIRVEPCRRGLRICDQLAVSLEQGRELADKLHDLIDSIEAGE